MKTKVEPQRGPQQGQSQTPLGPPPFLPPLNWRGEVFPVAPSAPAPKRHINSLLYDQQVTILKNEEERKEMLTLGKGGWVVSLTVAIKKEQLTIAHVHVEKAKLSQKQIGSVNLK